MRQKARWLSFETWACEIHCPSTKLPAALKTCWFINCSTRPPMQDRPVEVVPPEPVIEWVDDAEYVGYIKKRCSWGPCIEHARERSKYCSRTCSNKNARKRYKQRKVA